MKEELEQELFDRFPWLEARNVFTDEKLGHSFPCECEDGWYGLVFSMLEEIENHYKENSADINTISVYQLKEKFGTLNFYVGNVIDGTYEIINKYVDNSSEACEVCGDKGKIRIKGSWFKCLCEECKAKYGYGDCKE